MAGEACLMIRTKRIATGGWRTVESFWSARGTAFFRAPAGARIKVRYGVGWFGFDRQKQTLEETRDLLRSAEKKRTES
ncbi:MAG: hypothetical protein C4293_20235 [Nitrospiraceae bacterium]